MAVLIGLAQKSNGIGRRFVETEQKFLLSIRLIYLIRNSVIYHNEINKEVAG